MEAGRGAGQFPSSDDRYEALIEELAAEFVSLSADEVDAAIVDAQRRIVHWMGIDRCTLAQSGGRKGQLIITHSHAVEGTEAFPAIAADEHLPWMLSEILSGKVVVFRSLTELPPEAARDRQTLLRYGPRSNVSIPLIVGGRVTGALSFGCVREERYWSKREVNRLSTISRVFGGTLFRKQSELELRAALEEIRLLKERVELENTYLKKETAGYNSDTPLVGRSQAIRRVLSQAEQVASTDATVLITGETGTGKEIVASIIHEGSRRRAHPMVRVNCAAIPPALVESEFFGREKGAFTGALSKQIGRFELANGSTIFLDEVGELPPEVQVKLLRVLQEKRIERLGSPRSIPVDVRVIAATNRDLVRGIQEGGFREDLYYRLNVFPIAVPPLRERAEDVPVLVWKFVEELSHQMGKRIDSISRQTMESLTTYSWPGNVRELRNVIERAIILSEGSTLKAAPPSRETAGPTVPASMALRDVEAAHIRRVLTMTGWRVRGTGGSAALLGLNPSTLESRMLKLGIRRPGKASSG